MRPTTRHLSLLATLALCGCNAANSAAPSAVNVAVRPYTISGGGSELDVNRAISVAAGATVRVGFFTAINPDCTVIKGQSGRVIAPPLHGRLEITDTTDFPRFPATNPRFKCSSQRVPGYLVQYHSIGGFIGDDEMTYEEFMADGSLRRIRLTAHVL